MKLYCSIPGISDIESVNINESHASPTTIATIQARDLTIDIGDEIAIDMGYTTDHEVVFTGYVKAIDKSVPNNTYQITAYDKLIRAQDFFIVSSTPESPLRWRNVAVETLVSDLLALAGLSLSGHDDTLFNLGITSDVEINLISSYDICKQLGDIVTWNLWADADGLIYFMNRKPYVMTGTSGQPGDDAADVAENNGNPILTTQILDYTYKVNERNLRNKVIVYGKTGITAQASNSESFDPRIPGMTQVLPVGFYKSIVAGLPYVDTTAEAQDCADYNLELYNRLTEAMSITIEGDSNLHSHLVLDFDIPGTPETGLWYVYSCEHSWSSSGYTLNMELTR